MSSQPAASTLRKIQPLPVPADIVRSKEFGRKPDLQWVAPTDLYVDETYQRDLTERSGKLIRKMMVQFAWNRMKPPIVVKVGGKLHVVDGQHTAIVAASLGIESIPIFVVAADKVDERARAFVGHNSDRIVVPPINIYQALLAAEDPDAVDVANVCRRAGVKIRALSQSSMVQPGDTAAIGVIQKLVIRRGVMRARMVLEVLVKAKRVPIAAAEIAAVEHILCEAARETNLDRLARTIRVQGDQGFAQARARSAAERSPLWRVLVARWLPALKRVAA